jgi:hypothetical protein
MLLCLRHLLCTFSCTEVFREEHITCKNSKDHREHCTVILQVQTSSRNSEVANHQKLRFYAYTTFRLVCSEHRDFSVLFLRLF